MGVLLGYSIRIDSKGKTSTPLSPSLPKSPEDLVMYDLYSKLKFRTLYSSGGITDLDLHPTGWSVQTDPDSPRVLRNQWG